MHYFLTIFLILFGVFSAFSQSSSEKFLTGFEGVQDSLQNLSSKERVHIKKTEQKADSVQNAAISAITNSVDSLFNQPVNEITDELPDELKKDLGLPEKVDYPDLDVVPEETVGELPNPKSHNPDEALNSVNIDSELLEEIKAGETKLRELNSGIDEISGNDLDWKESSKKIDAKIENQVQDQEAVKQLKTQESEAINQQKELTDQKKELEDNAEKFRDKEKIKNEFRSKLDEQLAKSIVDHQQIIQSTQEKINKYKKNPYYKVGTVGQKENSFRNKPLKEKIHFGSNFQINNWNPLSVNIAPQLTYQFLPQWRTGVGATYRFGLSMDKPNSPSVNQSMHGYKSLVEWDGLYKIFLHTEYELLNETRKQPDTEVQKHEWRHYFLSGIGRRFSYSTFFKGSVMVLYNFKYKYGSSYPSPWVFRIGAEFSPKFFNKKAK